MPPLTAMMLIAHPPPPPPRPPPLDGLSPSQHGHHHCQQHQQLGRSGQLLLPLLLSWSSQAGRARSHCSSTQQAPKGGYIENTILGQQVHKFAYHAHNSVILSRMRKYDDDEVKLYNQVEVGTVEPDVRANLGILVILQTSD